MEYLTGLFEWALPAVWRVIGYLLILALGWSLASLLGKAIPPPPGHTKF